MLIKKKVFANVDYPDYLIVAALLILNAKFHSYTDIIVKPKIELICHNVLTLLITASYFYFFKKYTYCEFTIFL